MNRFGLAGLFCLGLFGGVFLSDVLLVFNGVSPGPVDISTGFIQLDLLMSFPAALILIYCVHRLSKWISVVLGFMIFLYFSGCIILHARKINDAIALYAARSEIGCGGFSGSGCSRCCGELVDFRSYVLTGRYEVVFGCNDGKRVEVLVFFHRGNVAVRVGDGDVVERSLAVP